MSVEQGKRKNDERRPFQWWLLVVGFAVGVIVTVIVFQVVTRTTGADAAEISVEGAQLTATAIIQQATQTAQAVLDNPNSFTPAANLEPIEMTATAIIQTATAQAGQSD